MFYSLIKNTGNTQRKHLEETPGGNTRRKQTGLTGSKSALWLGVKSVLDWPRFISLWQKNKDKFWNHFTIVFLILHQFFWKQQHAHLEKKRKCWRCIQVWEPQLLPSRRRLFQGRLCIFQQDNSRSAETTRHQLRSETGSSGKEKYSRGDAGLLMNVRTFLSAVIRWKY